MTDEDLFIVRARTKRGRIVYFLANFKSLIDHKHVDVVQYLDDTTGKWIEFSDIVNGTTLATNITSKKFKMTDLGPTIFYGFQVHFDIYSGRKLLYSKNSKGNPTEFLGYLKNNLIRHGEDLSKLTVKVEIIDFEDWYTSRVKNPKRKGEDHINFTVIHI